MKVRFWGVRGSIPVPGRATNRYGGNTSCVEVRPRNAAPIIIDAGTGIRRLGKSLMEDAFGDGKGSASILISHTH
jgi:phosphoribosyl 1,2-cyclic phosphodiesterase